MGTSNKSSSSKALKRTGQQHTFSTYTGERSNQGSGTKKGSILPQSNDKMKRNLTTQTNNMVSSSSPEDQPEHIRLPKMEEAPQIISISPASSPLKMSESQQLMSPLIKSNTGRETLGTMFAMPGSATNPGKHKA